MSTTFAFIQPRHIFDRAVSGSSVDADQAGALFIGSFCARVVVSFPFSADLFSCLFHIKNFTQSGHIRNNAQWSQVLFRFATANKAGKTYVIYNRMAEGVGMDNFLEGGFLDNNGARTMPAFFKVCCLIFPASFSPPTTLRKSIVTMSSPLSFYGLSLAQYDSGQRVPGSTTTAQPAGAINYDYTRGITEDFAGEDAWVGRASDPFVQVPRWDF